jgi:hypothetical protein
VPPPISSGKILEVPTGLSVERTADSLSVTLDPKGRESVAIALDTGLVAGVKHTLSVHPEGTSPGPGGYGLSGGLDFNVGTRIYHTSHEGIPVPGTRYVVEMEVFVFETDVPPQHHWSPESSPRYRVVWSRKLTQIVD